MYLPKLVEVFVKVREIERAELALGGDEAQLCVYLFWSSGSSLMSLARKQTMGITHGNVRSLLEIAKQRIKSDSSFAELVKLTHQAIAERVLFLESLKTSTNKRGGRRLGAGRKRVRLTRAA